MFEKFSMAQPNMHRSKLICHKPVFKHKQMFFCHIHSYMLVHVLIYLKDNTRHKNYYLFHDIIWSLREQRNFFLLEEDQSLLL